MPAFFLPGARTIRRGEPGPLLSARDSITASSDKYLPENAKKGVYQAKWEGNRSLD